MPEAFPELKVNFPGFDGGGGGGNTEAWTRDTVLAEIQANVMEPLLSELMPYLESWLD